MPDNAILVAAEGEPGPVGNVDTIPTVGTNADLGFETVGGFTLRRRGPYEVNETLLFENPKISPVALVLVSSIPNLPPAERRGGTAGWRLSPVRQRTMPDYMFSAIVFETITAAWIEEARPGDLPWFVLGADKSRCLFP